MRARSNAPKPPPEAPVISARMMNHLDCAAPALTSGEAACVAAAETMSAPGWVFEELPTRAAILERLYSHDIVELRVVYDPNPTGPCLPDQRVVVAVPDAEGLADFAARHEVHTISMPREALMPERRHRTR